MEWSNHRGPYTKYDGLPANYYAIFFLTVVRNSQQKINWFKILTKKENFKCEDKLNTCL